jgi:hypothetical protein
VVRELAEANGRSGPAAAAFLFVPVLASYVRLGGCTRMAIANAVRDATGKRVLDLPITLDKVL